MQKSIVKSTFENEPQSYWLASTASKSFPAMPGNIKADVAVIGGGIAGITAAYLLKKEGLKVVLIEARRILQGTTAYTTAKLTSLHRLIYHYLITNYGEENAGLYADAHQSSIDFVENIINENNIDCDFKRLPHLVYTQLDSFVDQVEKEVNCAKRLGLPAEFVRETGLPFETRCAVRFNNQAQFHPLKYLNRLVDEIPGDGCEVYENTRALDIEGTSPVTVSTDRGLLKASKVIIATKYPFYDRKGLYFSRLYQSRSYILAMSINGSLTEGMYISAEDPVCSLRTQPHNGGELVLLSGEGHKTGQGDNTKLHYELLKKLAEEIFDVKSIDYRWSAQDAMTLDSIPYIGRLTSDTENIFVATGFKKWGMTGGTVSARILTDMIMERENAWASIINPSRTNFGTQAAEFVKTNATVAKELVTGKVSSSYKTLEDLKNGEGSLIGSGGSKLAAFRDDKGKIHKFDATCRHLGCEVVWNEAENTWDCPCHGSRYSSVDGSVIESPTVMGLDTAKED